MARRLSSGWWGKTGTMKCRPMRDPNFSREGRFVCLGVIDLGMTLAMGQREVVSGFRSRRVTWQHWVWVGQARSGGHIPQSGILFT